MIQYFFSTPRVNSSNTLYTILHSLVDFALDAIFLNNASMSFVPYKKVVILQQIIFKRQVMKLKKLSYIFIVVVLSAFLFLSFIVDTFNVDAGCLSSVLKNVSSPFVLAVGIVFAMLMGEVYSKFNKLMSKKMLQYSVVSLGFGMNIEKALASGWEGMLLTVVSVFATLGLGWVIGRKLLGVDSETSYLLSSGTAICGGSAIAAVGSALNAKSENLSVALAVVFVLNALALFLFPSIGSALGMSMKQFGMWAAIAIHDTSSVVGAGAAYDQLHPELVSSQGVSALELATTIKLTRALWIVVLVLLTPFFMKSHFANNVRGKAWYRNIPTFIVWFLLAILFNTYVLSNSSLLGEKVANIGGNFSRMVADLAKHMITLSMFFIGASLTINTLRKVGLKPMIQGVVLWICVSVISLAFIISCRF